MIRIVTVLGARPQFIKAATVSRAINHANEYCKKSNVAETYKEVILHTGQHFDTNMSAIFFEELSIPAPHYNLGIADLSHGAMTGRMLEGIEDVLKRENPHWVLVYGDTNSTLAGALAATKRGIPVVRACVRTAISNQKVHLLVLRSRFARAARC